MSDEHRFGELRSLMQETPSREVWVRLVALLDGWPAETLESEALPYVCDHLRSWSVERSAPERWERAARETGSSPRLLACTELWWAHEQLEPGQLGRLLGCPHTRNLRTIDLEMVGCGVSPEDMLVLAYSTNLDALKTLSLEMTLEHGERGMEALGVLAGARGLLALRRLSLMSNELPAEALRVLRSGGLLERLTELELAYNDLGGGMTHLDGMRWERIERLDLRGCELGDEDARALARLDAPGLRTLLLSENQLSREGVEALLSSASLPGLERLEIRDCWLDLVDKDVVVEQASRRAVRLVAYDEEGSAAFMLR